MQLRSLLSPVKTSHLLLKHIVALPQQDKELLNSAVSNKDYHLKSFSAGSRAWKVICYKGKIVLPSALQEQAVQWYHTYLCHPGENQTEQTLRQHFTWKT